MDILSDVLSPLHIQTFALASLQMREPWNIDYEHRDAMLFHYISSGECWLREDDHPPQQVRAGHVILLPTWKHMHLQAPLDGSEAETITKMIVDREQSLWVPGHSTTRPIRIRNEGRGKQCEILSGIFEFDRLHSSFLVERLPELIILDTHAVQMGPWLAQTLEFLAQEAQRDTPGYEVVAARVTDLILIQLLRLYIHLHTDQSPSWISGLSDYYIGKALLSIHRSPEQNWTVANLGKEVGLSRTAFATRFANKTGMTPLDYITRWRMHLAATRLMQTDSSIEKIGVSVGYPAPSAFVRAFKRQYGMSPGTFRKNPNLSP